MNNVQHLLDTLGPPPAEVCLDWAWQLGNLADQSSSPGYISWSRLRIDQSGRLSLDKDSQIDAASLTSRDTTSSPASNSSAAESQSIAGLVQQLLDWSGDAKEQVNSAAENSIQEHRQSLGKLLLAIKANKDPSSNSDPLATKIVQAIDDTSDRDFAEVTTSDNEEFSVEPLSNSVVISEPANSTYTVSRAPKQPAKKRISSVMLWSGASAGLATIALIVMFAWPSAPTNSNTNLSSADSPETTTPVGSAGSKKGKTKTPASIVQSVDESAGSSELELVGNAENELTTLQAAQGQTTQLGLLEETLNNLAPATPADALSGLSNRTAAMESPKSESGQQPESVSELKIESQAESQASSPASIDASAATSSDSSNNAIPPNTAPLEDVTSMLAEAAKAEPKINNLDTAVDDAGIPKLPVQLLEIESMLQVQEISAKIRVRQPVWQLRIASTEDFAVDPPGIQSLAEKETIRWTLTATEMKPRKDQEPTQVFVFAQLSGRRADIKWKIAAGCADLPAISVPLNEERLDAMLDMLQAYQQRLSSSVANIKDSVELPGMPREYKSVLTAQRKAMENQGKLVARARQIIADAGMFVGWLDRSIEMHGNLTDQVAGQSVTILQIGQPDQPEVEAEPKVEAKTKDNNPAESEASDQ